MSAGADGSAQTSGVRRRFVLCATPAQGHAAPLLGLATRLVGDGHDVVFFTTSHYRDRVLATGASFVPFAAEYDAHDLMVANPDRESSSTRGVRGVKADLRQIFIGPIAGQHRDLCALLADSPADAVVFDTMFLGALPLAFWPAATRPRLACIGVMPYASNSCDTAPFGIGLQPGSSPWHRLRNRSLNWLTQRVVLADIQRLAKGTLSELGAPPLEGYCIDWPPRLVDVYLQATVPGFEYPRSDLAPSVRFVGPVLAAPSPGFEAPAWWHELSGERPVVHVTQGTLDNADLGRLLLSSFRALADEDVLVVGTTGGPDPDPWRNGLPANARLERFIPHDRLLPHTDVMITNGGYGGVQQALANGVPLVVAGDSEDKPEVAARVRWSGVGVDLRTGRPSEAKIAQAVRRILEDPSYRRHARALQDEIAASEALGDITRVLLELTEPSARAGQSGGSGRSG
jgi:UDP:flavonoid glycosyltransferase YjiC (YdhE family)